MYVERYLILVELVKIQSFSERPWFAMVLRLISVLPFTVVINLHTVYYKALIAPKYSWRTYTVLCATFSMSRSTYSLRILAFGFSDFSFNKLFICWQQLQTMSSQSQFPFASPKFLLTYRFR